MEIKKLTIEVKSATYFTVIELTPWSFENNKKIDPIAGSNINEDKIGKFILFYNQKG